MTNLRAHMASLSDCLMSYENELDSFRREMELTSTSSFNSDFSYEPPLTTLLKFQTGGQWLDTTAHRYFANDLSKKELAESFSRMGESLVTVPAERLCYDMEESLFEELTEIFDDQQKTMVRFYSDLLRRVTSLQRYMFANDTALEQFARRLSIWRMPKVNFQTPQVYLYLLLSPPPRCACGVLQLACLSVCLSLCLSVRACQEPLVRTSPNFLQSMFLFSSLNPLLVALQCITYFRFCG